MLVLLQDKITTCQKQRKKETNKQKTVHNWNKEPHAEIPSHILSQICNKFATNDRHFISLIACTSQLWSTEEIDNHSWNLMKDKLSMTECGHHMELWKGEYYILSVRLCTCPEISPKPNTVQSLEKPL